MATKCLATQELLLVYCLVLAGRIYVFGQLETISSCTCVGYTATYQCTAAGNGVTIWQGKDSFNCPRNRIVLRHENFIRPHGAYGDCNGFIGQSLPYMKGDNYSSQLTVNVTPKLNGTTIECQYESLTTNERSEIGRTQLILTTEPFDPPNDIHLTNAGQGSLSFSWSAVANSCSSLQYQISSTCGDCPSITNATSVVCTVDDTMSQDARECSFKIRSVVCDNLTGRWSDPINVTLNVTEPPVITDVQATSDANGMTESVIADGDHARHQPMVIILASVLVAVLLMTVVGWAIIIIIAFKICRRYPLDESTTGQGYHAIFELLDEPWQLLNILQGIKDLDVSIMDTKIGRCTPNKTRKIYLRFNGNFPAQLAERMKRKIDERTTTGPGRSMMDSEVSSSCSIQPTEVDELESEVDDTQTCSLSIFCGPCSKTYTYSRRLPPRPGALCSLIEGIRSKDSSYNSINIIGIAGTPKRQGDTLIHLRFISDLELPRSWRRDFNSIKVC